jgi:hypothetical protein
VFELFFALILWELCSRYAKIRICGWNRWNQASSVNHGMSSIPGELWRKSWNRWQRRTGVCLVASSGWLLSFHMAGAFLLCVISAVSVAIRNNKIQQYLHNKVLCIECFIVTYLPKLCWIGSYICDVCSRNSQINGEVLAKVFWETAPTYQPHPSSQPRTSAEDVFRLRSDHLFAPVFLWSYVSWTELTRCFHPIFSWSVCVTRCEAVLQ